VILGTSRFCDLGLSLSISAAPPDYNRLTPDHARVALAVNSGTERLEDMALIRSIRGAREGDLCFR
jgi:hypothetical protein